jgi:hypothetical protein
MIHAKAMAVVVAYDIYLELAEGSIDPDWKLVDAKGKSDPVAFHTFRETLARQMLAYTPKKNKYLGDDKFREYTKVTKAKRARSVTPAPAAIAADGTVLETDAGINPNALNEAATKHAARLSCGFTGHLTEHLAACGPMPEKGKKLKCAFCGKPSYQLCGLCGVALHKFPQPGVGDGITSCFMLYHDKGCFGLARDDWKLTNKKKMKDWTYPTMADRKANEAQMKRLSDHVARSTVGAVASAPSAPSAPSAAAPRAPSAAAPRAAADSDSD